jgi:hypothetical protein
MNSPYDHTSCTLVWFCSQQVDSLQKAAENDGVPATKRKILQTETTTIPLSSMTTLLNQTTPNTDHSNNSGIPKIIHLIWLTNSSFSASSIDNRSTAIDDDDAETSIPEDGSHPTYFVQNMKRFQELHVDYQVKLWRNKNVLTTFPELPSRKSKS